MYCQSFLEWCAENRIFGAERLWRDTIQAYASYVRQYQEMRLRHRHDVPVGVTMAEAFTSAR